VRCGAVRCGAVRCGAVRCGAVRCGAVRCGAVRCGAVRCGAGGRGRRCRCLWWSTAESVLWMIPTPAPDVDAPPLPPRSPPEIQATMRRRGGRRVSRAAGRDMHSVTNCRGARSFVAFRGSGVRRATNPGGRSRFVTVCMFLGHFADYAGVWGPGAGGQVSAHQHRRSPPPGRRCDDGCSATWHVISTAGLCRDHPGTDQPVRPRPLAAWLGRVCAFSSRRSPGPGSTIDRLGGG
jgi:hypothetical protein